MTEERLLQLKAITKEMRVDILNMCHSCGRNNAHLSGCLSAVEILAVLFLEIIKIRNIEPIDSRDRFVLSKGHAGIALYAALKQVGILSQEEIENPLRGTNSFLFRHPKRNPDKHKMTAGSLGQGLSYGVGLAVAMKKKPLDKSRIFVTCLDGDGAVLMHTGSLAIIGNRKPKNFRHIVLNNGAHDSVGGQPTVGMQINIPAIALACGYEKALTVQSAEELRAILQEIDKEKRSGPVLIEVRVRKGARSDLGHPCSSPIENKKAFMEGIR